MLRDRATRLALRPQKITVLIEVVPSPRLNVVGKHHHARPITGMTKVRRAIDNALANKSIDDAVVDREVQASALAFNVAPEDLFLFAGESMESLLSGEQKTVVVVFPGSGFNGGSDGNGDTKQQQPTKIRLTFIPIFQKPNSVNDGIGREKRKRRNDTKPNAVFEWLLEEFKKCFHGAFNGHMFCSWGRE
jgi:hypothetical protein